MSPADGECGFPSVTEGGFFSVLIRTLTGSKDANGKSTPERRVINERIGTRRAASCDHGSPSEILDNTSENFDVLFERDRAAVIPRSGWRGE